MRLDSIAARIAVAFVLAIVLSIALTVAVSISRGFLLMHAQGHSNTQMFLGRSFVATINRYHNPQLLSARFAAIAAAMTKALASEHPALLAAFTDPPLRVEIRDQPTIETSSNPRVELIRDLIEFQLQSAPDTVRVDTRQDTERSDEAAPEQLVAEIALPDGKWLVVTNSDFALEGPSKLLFALLISLALLIAALSMWTARRITRPISAFAAAAERFGASSEAIPLPESGPRELRAATRTFNQMQERLRRFVSDRTLMVAAMSHDLKTPLTRIRLRTELIGDGTQQAKILADIDEMTAMIESTLAFARDDAKREASLLVDLGALVESVCENAIDTGHDVEMSSARRAILVICRPVAISRAVANLVDNAVKYGGNARVRLDRFADRAVVTVDDDGPGIPDEEREKVFAPFYRIESSRNRDTGGVGLGLAVARNSAREHGGDLTLGRNESGGLRARLELPAVEARDISRNARWAGAAKQQDDCVTT
jgi:signal transduction histidine kinase